MNLAQELKIAVAPWTMLKHPFDQAWSDGSLSLGALQNYSMQYRPFVNHFPRYVSAIHSRCENAAHRQELLRNLLDEEGYPDQKDHPTLWKDFAVGIGVNPAAYDHEPSKPWATQLHDAFWGRSQSSYHQGLGCLFAYEHQIPEVAEVKIAGLKKHFGIEDAGALEFFRLHQIADVYHSQSCEALLNAIETDNHSATLEAAQESAKDLWNFLSQCERA
jgi:pyrroloquinoline-quinone synthase